MAVWHFAWVDEDDDEWVEDFAREDEQIVSITRDQSEGNFASLTIVVRNPGHGLLAPGQPQWAWLAYENDTEVTPLFFGQLVAFPEDFAGESVSLLFVARPLNVAAQKNSLAATLREAPFYDRIFIKPEDADNPETVLNARPYRWHFDPVTHDVTISHITNGEDGTVSFGEGQITYDGSTFTYSTPPLGRIKVEAKVNWTQRAKGTVDLTRKLLDAGVAAGSTNWNMLQSYTADGLVSAWPLPGGDIGGGWSIADTNVTLGKRMPLHIDDILKTVYIEPDETSQDSIMGIIAPNGNLPTEPKRLRIPRTQLEVTFIAQFDAARSRSETMLVELVGGIQPLTTDPTTGVTEAITLESNDVSEPVDGDDTGGSSIPIGDVRRNSYFKTDRGKESVEYILALAGTVMLQRSRAIELTVTVPFEHGMDVSLRNDAHLTHRLLPGGEATGKVIATRLQYDQDQQYAQITIGCCVGLAGTLSADPGEPTYVDDDYVEEDYQARTGEMREVLPDLFYYSFDDAEIDDDGYNFLAPVTAENALLSLLITNGPQAQKDALNAMTRMVGSQDEVIAQLNALATQICINLKPVNAEPFETTIELETEVMILPQGIDLETGATA